MNGSHLSSFVGNALDPQGLAPVTDEDLTGYTDSLQGPLSQAAGAAGH
ncbi:hypothetical protein [Klugiella xanthotipulae]|nr:hypothetical protein [Klugiella xanthotipulae]